MIHEHWKRSAAEAALAEVLPGMRLGLGTGSTARHFVDLLGVKVRDGLSVTAVATSEATRVQAERVGIALTDLDTHPELDLTIDGADELDPQLRLIKGGGAALLREKIVARASKRMIVIADVGKLVPRLGAFPLPVEVVRFGLGATARHIRAACAFGAEVPAPVLRRDAAGREVLTDNGHLILDCHLGEITEAEVLAERLATIPGVVEHGLFLGMAHAAYLGGPDGVAVHVPNA